MLICPRSTEIITEINRFIQRDTHNNRGNQQRDSSCLESSVVRTMSRLRRKKQQQAKSKKKKRKKESLNNCHVPPLSSTTAVVASATSTLLIWSPCSAGHNKLDWWLSYVRTTTKPPLAELLFEKILKVTVKHGKVSLLRTVGLRQACLSIHIYYPQG